MSAVAIEKSSSTNAGIIRTAPAPIIAAARPTCPAFSDSSARASANSLPTSLASCAIASPNSSGIERSVGEFIAIALARCAARIGRRIAGLRTALGGTLQKPHDAESGKNRDPKKRRGLPAGERLRVLHQIVQVSIPNTFGNFINLPGCLADVRPGDWKFRVEFTRGASHGFGESADILSAR